MYVGVVFGFFLALLDSRDVVIGGWTWGFSGVFGAHGFRWWWMVLLFLILECLLIT